MNEWINVKDRLPEIENKSIFFTFYSNVNFSYFIEGKFVNILGMEVMVSHWIEVKLPEPPTK